MRVSAHPVWEGVPIYASSKLTPRGLLSLCTSTPGPSLPLGCQSYKATMPRRFLPWSASTIFVIAHDALFKPFPCLSLFVLYGIVLSFSFQLQPAYLYHDSTQTPSHARLARHHKTKS
ncbi:hypothetical protein VFPPC_18119 [Pochonia chlamydosporia 170]|uniref:Uncharacterized protein n=1 Tax=Pochonia chlamydosporia 170 TaxID=1380566 RepID=A0A219APG1_METCM|nr:hypothetical protein VFPPC_18119 [Pochonia chlamydosporia 170]OWT42706.1 hypothetical protein VFPPC_18119 [Pochonia chlamydosporia 170]